MAAVVDLLIGAMIGVLVILAVGTCLLAWIFVADWLRSHRR